MAWAGDGLRVLNTWSLCRFTDRHIAMRCSLASVGIRCKTISPCWSVSFLYIDTSCGLWSWCDNSLDASTPALCHDDHEWTINTWLVFSINYGCHVGQCRGLLKWEFCAIFTMSWFWANFSAIHIFGLFWDVRLFWAIFIGEFLLAGMVTFVVALCIMHAFDVYAWLYVDSLCRPHRCISFRFTI